MKRSWRWIGSRTGVQVIIILLVSIIMPGVFLFLFMVRRYSHDLLTTAIEERKNLLEAANKSIALLLENYDELSMTVYYDASTKRYIDGGVYGESSDAMEVVMKSILNTRRSTNGIALCLENQVYTYGKSYVNLQEYRDRYEAAVIAAEGKRVWLPTNIMQSVNSARTKCYALGRAINSPSGAVGVLYMFFYSDSLAKLMNYPVLTESGSHWYIFSDDGKIIGSDRKQLVGTSEGTGISPALLSSDSGYVFITGEDGQPQIAVYDRLQETGWTSVAVVDREELYSRVNSLIRLSVLFSVFYVIVLLCGYFAMHRFIVRPIGMLSSGMERVSLGEFREVPLPPGGNEIRQLAEKYNEMIIKIQRLLARVRSEEEAKNLQRIKVLYMQIGPHFLYNTLNSIKWMAVLNKQQSIKMMVESLMKLTSGVAYNKQDDISVREEIDLVESYIYIQKIRFMNFTVEYDIPENVMGLMIGRFMLQPFVENCIIHGFRGSSREGRIQIRMRRGEDLMVEIIDNGRGLPAAAPKDPFSAAKTEDAAVPGPEQSVRDSVGIENVRERIRLHYGERYQVQIGNNADGGVRVCLTLPVIEGRSDDSGSHCGG
ncbi:sensor histidine kinase [Lachnoclostridium sp. Marseille-P6806]|uniref:sensor histidine kinase n=1 Tax=Lachnoclostridium sp. Marseille-P6806 TaxID=2364793 RepID=UPI00102FFD99|nr:sensor histidine kinase [Lachnoclostridium sp. Marseille-P6806]